MEQVKETTAMQQLIEWVDKELKLLNYEHQVIIDKATELLEVEKQQIIRAFNQGYREGEGEEYNPEKDISEYYDAECYYYNKYK